MVMKGRDSSGEVLRAPGSSSVSRGSALKLPSPSSFPPVDERLARPETRDEIVRGRRVIAQPSLPPHGDRHCELDYVVRAHIRPGYISSTDLLTRTAAESDFATDTCVRKAGVDRETGQRWLEELAFEVVYTQSTKEITERAEDLAGRGVRRLFAIFVKESAVKEWSPGARAFHALAPGSAIEDPCLSQPLRVRALLDAAEADDAVAQALAAKGNPVIAALREESRREGTKAALRRLFEKRLGRALTEAEGRVFSERLERQGEEPVSDAVLELSADGLAGWLSGF